MERHNEADCIRMAIIVNDNMIFSNAEAVITGQIADIICGIPLINIDIALDGVRRFYFCTHIGKTPKTEVLYELEVSNLSQQIIYCFGDCDNIDTVFKIIEHIRLYTWHVCLGKEFELMNRKSTICFDFSKNNYIEPNIDNIISYKEFAKKRMENL